MVISKKLIGACVLGLASTSLFAQSYDSTNPFVGSNAAGLEKRYQEDLSNNPFDPIALNNLAVTRAEQGDVYAAEEMLQRAARLAPTNTEIKRNLNRVLQWQEVQSNEFVPPARYALPEGFGEQGLPPAPPPLWQSKTQSYR